MQNVRLTSRENTSYITCRYLMLKGLWFIHMMWLSAQLHLDERLHIELLVKFSTKPWMTWKLGHKIQSRLIYCKQKALEQFLLQDWTELLLVTFCSKLVLFSLFIPAAEADFTDELIRPYLSHVLRTDLMHLASAVVAHNKPTTVFMTAATCTSFTQS